MTGLYYTPYCAVCDEAVTPPLPEHLICRACLAALPFRMNREAVSWDNPWPLYASFFYRDAIRKMMISIKFSERTDRAEAIGSLMARTVCRHRLSVDAVIPVPLHHSRLRERGFNQVDIMGGALAARLRLPLVTTLLSRMRDTPRQSEARSAEERRRHLRNAFVVDRKCDACKALAGRTVLLVDDVMTTGSTLSAAAGALDGAGIRVICLAAASGRDAYIGYGEALSDWHREPRRY